MPARSIKPAPNSQWPDPYVAPVVTVPAAAALLGVSRATVYRMIDRGEVHVSKDAEGVRVPVRELYLFAHLGQQMTADDVPAWVLAEIPPWWFV